MRVLFFDTETTGLPADWKAPMQDLDNWPRVIQLAWEVYELDGEHAGEFFESASRLILPDGWTIPDGSDGEDAGFWIEHGYNTAKSVAEGIPIGSVLNEFIADLDGSDLMVSHNLAFDYNVLGAEMIRASKKAKRKVPQLCTKTSTTDFCRIPFAGARRFPGGRQSFKWPKLSELHQKLFNEDFEGAHDALADVRALARCFFELKRLKVLPV